MTGWSISALGFLQFYRNKRAQQRKFYSRNNCSEKISSPIFIKFVYLNCLAYIRSFLCFDRQPGTNWFIIFLSLGRLGWLYLMTSLSMTLAYLTWIFSKHSWKSSSGFHIGSNFIVLFVSECKIKHSRLTFTHLVSGYHKI